MNFDYWPSRDFPPLKETGDPSDTWLFKNRWNYQGLYPSNPDAANVLPRWAGTLPYTWRL